MPGTWAVLRTRYGLGSNAYDPRDNIMAGAAYIREMYEQFGAPGFLGAYNAGPGRYGDYVTKGRSLPTETLAYIAKIAPEITDQTQVSTSLAAHGTAISVQASWTHAALFAVRQDHSAMNPAGANELAQNVRGTNARTLESTNPSGLFVKISSQISE
jgi:Transglycosylase SLT domain